MGPGVSMVTKVMAQHTVVIIIFIGIQALQENCELCARPIDAKTLVGMLVYKEWDSQGIGMANRYIGLPLGASGYQGNKSLPQQSSPPKVIDLAEVG